MAIAANRRFRFRVGKDAIESRWQALRRRYKWWQLTLFSVGVISALSVFGALFFAVGHQPSRVYTDSSVPHVGSPAFVTALGALVGAPVERGGTVTILNNGDGFLPALLQSIGEARKTINFSVYIWSDGNFSEQVLQALEQKQRQGVAVRILLDGLGSLKISDGDFEPLVKAGGRVTKYRTPKFGKLTRFHRRNHRSRELDEENVFGIDDPAFAGELRKVFLADLDRSKPIDLEQWRRRNPMQKLFETVSRTLDQQS